MRQSSSFLQHHKVKMLIQGIYLGMQLSILKVMLKEKISCFDEILLVVSKFPEPEKEAYSGSANYLQAACCKSCNQRCWQVIILICTTSEDVSPIQDE